MPNKEKLTVEDFARIYESHSAVRIETQPGKFETLNFGIFDITDVIKIMSSSLHEAIQTYNNNFEKTFGSPFLQAASSENATDRMMEYLLEKDIIATINYDEYDEETLEAFKLYQRFEVK